LAASLRWEDLADIQRKVRWAWAGGKREVIASSRGGGHSATETLQALNHQEIYLRTAPCFRCVIHVSAVRAEDLQLSEAGEGPPRWHRQRSTDWRRRRPEEGTFSNPGATHEL
jgi:hypothetical protein